MRAFLILSAVFFSIIVIVFSSVAFFAFPLKYQEYIRAASIEFGVDKVLIASVIRAESRFRPDAVSSKGAIGLMQIMPQTAKFIAAELELTDYDVSDPQTNIIMGTFYLRYLLDKFLDVKTALAAYNAGEGRVVTWLNGAERLETTPFRETNEYIERVMNARTYYRLRL